MALQDILIGKKKQILERWFKSTIDTYPPESSNFIHKERDRFLNPVGSTIRKEMECLFDELTGKMNADKLNDALENIVKIRAVQGFKPSESVAFVFLMKRIIVEEIMRDVKSQREEGRGKRDEQLPMEDGRGKREELKGVRGQ